jgi:NAD(P)-dependent dehydrogenase (short-subunit alcohol dehydrogenase family)
MAKLQQGQTAVVTGGAAGIGYALAETLVRRGLRVVISDVDAGALSQAVDRLAALGGDVLSVRTDVSDRSAVRELRRQVTERFGGVDLLCNNAGLYQVVEPVWEIDIDGWRRLFEVNFWGVVYGIHEFVPDFLAKRSGHVLITASMSGLSTVPGSADYGSSKHAVIALSETLRADLEMAGASSIGVTVLCPALVKTSMGDRALGLFARPQAQGDREGIGGGPNLMHALDPYDVAEAAVRGIEAGRRYVTPTPGSRDRFMKRIQPILDSFDGH